MIHTKMFTHQSLKTTISDQFVGGISSSAMFYPNSITENPFESVGEFVNFGSISFIGVIMDRIKENPILFTSINENTVHSLYLIATNVYFRERSLPSRSSKSLNSHKADLGSNIAMVYRKNLFTDCLMLHKTHLKLFILEYLTSDYISDLSGFVFIKKTPDDRGSIEYYDLCESIFHEMDIPTIERHLVKTDLDIAHEKKGALRNSRMSNALLNDQISTIIGKSICTKADRSKITENDIFQRVS